MGFIFAWVMGEGIRKKLVGVGGGGKGIRKKIAIEGGHPENNKGCDGLLRLPHTSRFFVVEMQIFRRGQMGLKFVGTSAHRTPADFLSRLTAFRLLALSGAHHRFRTKTAQKPHPLGRHIPI